MDPRSPSDHRQPGAAEPADQPAQPPRYPAQNPGISPQYSAPPPAWGSGGPLLRTPDPLGIRLLVNWHTLLAIGFGFLTVGLLLLGVFIALLGEGTPATLSDRLTFYGSLFLMVCAPLFGCVSSIALSRGMERRRRWTVWGSLALHILLILITVPLMGFMGLIAIIPGAILILIAPVVVVYLLLPGTRAQFRQP